MVILDSYFAAALCLCLTLRVSPKFNLDLVFRILFFFYFPCFFSSLRRSSWISTLKKYLLESIYCKVSTRKRFLGTVLEKFFKKVSCKPSSNQPIEILIDFQWNPPSSLTKFSQWSGRDLGEQEGCLCHIIYVVYCFKKRVLLEEGSLEGLMSNLPIYITCISLLCVSHSPTLISISTFVLSWWLSHSFSLSDTLSECLSESIVQSPILSVCF